VCGHPSICPYLTKLKISFLIRIHIALDLFQEHGSVNLWLRLCLYVYSSGIQSATDSFQEHRTGEPVLICVLRVGISVLVIITELYKLTSKESVRISRIYIICEDSLLSEIIWIMNYCKRNP